MLEVKKIIALTFDVELWSEGEWLKPYITPLMEKTDTFPQSIEIILRLLKDNGSRATFFTTLEIIEKYPGIIKTISNNGHEIGMHGPRHKKLKDYPQTQFRQDLTKHVRHIVEITGKKPLGYRAPHFSLNNKTDWVLPLLKEFGLIYDSSIFPINLGEYGVSNAPTSIYEIFPGLQEIPITVAKFWKIRIPFAGGIYLRVMPYWLFKFLLERSFSGKQAPMIYFHPHELDSSTPQIKSGPRLKRYIKYFGVNTSLNKLERVLKEYRCDSIEKLFFS